MVLFLLYNNSSFLGYPVASKKKLIYSNLHFKVMSWSNFGFKSNFCIQTLFILVDSCQLYVSEERSPLERL